MDPQDIDTAPGDGTRILVYVPPHKPTPGEIGDIMATTCVDNEEQWIAYSSGWFTAWFDHGLWYTGLREHIERAGPLDDEPTHWMPLPEAPRD